MQGAQKPSMSDGFFNSLRLSPIDCGGFVLPEKITTKKIIDMKRKSQRIVELTAYDYPSAMLADEAGVDIILVGDSLGMVVLGYENTLKVTLEDMIYHTKAVVRGAKRPLVITDMPFMSYQISKEQALESAGRIIKEGEAHGVKLEGGDRMVETIAFITQSGIPVQAHLGLTPQSINQIGGYSVQGKSDKSARKMLSDAKAIEQAGAFSLVLECVPDQLAKLISEEISIPTIGIGAGKDTDGQVLVFHDLLGYSRGYLPKFVRRYENLADTIKVAIEHYSEDVRSGLFPGDEEIYQIKNLELSELLKEINQKENE
jgi:3-methyl-2-oxobutanoate hydroxymethyltransferase